MNSSKEKLQQHMKDRMVNGKLYVGWELPPEKTRLLLRKFNRAPLRLRTKRTARYLEKLFGKMGNGAYIEDDFYCDHGFNIFVGDNFYANKGLIILDQCPVTIGDNVFIGPRCGIYGATHPIAASIRNLQIEGGKPISIGNDVWIGGDVTICPGVKIGSNVVIGAGSVVCRDIPDNCIAVGNPCAKLRDITEEDQKFWEEQMDEFRKDTGIILT